MLVIKPNITTPKLLDYTLKLVTCPLSELCLLTSCPTNTCRLLFGSSGKATEKVSEEVLMSKIQMWARPSKEPWGQTPASRQPLHRRFLILTRGPVWGRHSLDNLHALVYFISSNPPLFHSLKCAWVLCHMSKKNVTFFPTSLNPQKMEYLQWKSIFLETCVSPVLDSHNEKRGRGKRRQRRSFYSRVR